jgi:hypothetical protein
MSPSACRWTKSNSLAVIHMWLWSKLLPDWYWLVALKSMWTLLTPPKPPMSNFSWQHMYIHTHTHCVYQCLFFIAIVCTSKFKGQWSSGGFHRHADAAQCTLEAQATPIDDYLIYSRRLTYTPASTGPMSRRLLYGAKVCGVGPVWVSLPYMCSM